MKLLVLVLFGVLFVCKVSGFSFGSPWSRCLDPYPHHHGHTAQRTESPYKIKLSKDNYDPSDEITVTLEASSGSHFKGYIIAAFRTYRTTPGDSEDVVGHFTEAPDDAQQYSFPWFLNPVNNCVTHKDATEKNKITFKWQAPFQSEGDVEFKASFVEDFETFWVNVSSPVLKANVAAANRTFPMVYESFDPRLSLNECGKSKGCLLFPDQCTGFNCKYVVTYQSNGPWVDFEISGPATGHSYLSLGFSKDRFMGDDETITCVAANNQVWIQEGFNPEYYNDRYPTKSVSNMQVKEEDGYLNCRFRRPIIMTSQKVHLGHSSNITFDLQKPAYGFLAWGNVPLGSLALDKHIELPLVSPAPVNFVKTEVIYMAGLPVTIIAHAIMMLIAWMGLSGFAMIVARHFRNGFNGNTVCYIPAWFQLHRLSLFLVFFLTAAGFILIFIHVNGWRQDVTLHAVLGIIVMAFCSLQVILGICRPPPDHPNRNKFNWFHRIVGKLTHIISAFCIMLGFNAYMIHKDMAAKETIIVGCWIGAQIAWEIIFELLRCCRGPVNYESSTKMKTFGENGDVAHVTPKPKPVAPTSVEHVALVFFVLSTLAFLGVSITFLFV